MIIALIISLFINFIFLVTSQDCSSCVVFRMVQEKNEKILEGETLFLKFPSIDHPSVRHMKLVFNMFPGTTQVKMVMADTRKVYATQVQLHRALVEEAKEVLGEENVVIR